MAYKTKAEKNFDSRFKLAIEFKDFDTVEMLLVRLGSLYELVDDQPWNKTYPDGKDFIWPTLKEENE